MIKKRPVKIIAAVFFTFLLAFLTYHIMSVITISGQYEGDGGPLSRFIYAEGRIFSDPIGNTFSKTAYRIFGISVDKRVDAGKDGYLFPTKTDKFDYTADIRGEAPLSDELLEQYKKTVSDRLAAYGAEDCAFYVFVIPNSASANRDKVVGKTGVTAASQLEEYLKSEGISCFYLLDGALSDTVYDTYHNTENAINEYGAYKAYDVISSLMPEAVKKRGRRITVDADDIIVTYSDGRYLARLAGLEKTVRNKNVFYSVKRFTDVYGTSVDGALTYTTMKEEYNGVIGRSEILVDIPSSYERGLFMPLLSATYTNVTYRDVLSYSNSVMSGRSPAAALCIIREDELSQLLDPYDVKTYSDRTGEFEQNGTTQTPTVERVSRCDPETVIIAGRCEDRAYVTAGASDDEQTVVCRDGLYIIALRAKENERIRITAKAENKITSDAVYANAPSDVTSDGNAGAGGYSMLYYTPTLTGYTGSDLMDTDALALMRRRFEIMTEKVRSASGKDTKIIFLAAPDPLSVYPQAAPASVYQSRARVTRLDQVKEALSGIDGFTFIDIRDDMRASTDLGKLYYQTDTHWTELGAYFGYRAILNVVSEDFPAAAPFSLNAFTTDEHTVPGGDLCAFAGLYGVKEKIYTLTPDIQLRASGVPGKPDTIDRSIYSGAAVSLIRDGSLPSAVMIRDSYSANLYPLINEHFSLLYSQAMWDYQPDINKISAYKPDYLIFVICERNLGVWN